jgi:hypothetical protein
MRTCLVCDRPVMNKCNDGHVLCSLHSYYALSAANLRYDILGSNAKDGHAKVAVDLFKSLSEDAQYGMSILMALLVEQMIQRAQKRGRNKSGLGAVGALELLVQLVAKGVL